MSISERDEFPHTPPAPLNDRWQENFFVVCWSLEDGVGLMIHWKRWPATGHLTSRIVAVFGDKVVSRKVVQAIPADEFRVDGLKLEVVTPFRELRLKGGFAGTKDFGPLGFVAWRQDGTVPVEVDLTLRSDLIPADFAAGFDALAAMMPASSGGKASVFEHTQEHYEQGGRCEGFISIDGDRRKLQGLFVRDHTWGRRDESAMSTAGHGFWTASVSEDADFFFNATGMVVNGETKGIGVVVDRNGQSTTTDIRVDFLPKGGLQSFSQTRIHIGGDKPVDVLGTANTHLIKYLPGSGPRRFDDNAISRFEGGGIAGFGVHEYAGTLTAEQTETLEAAES